MYLVILILFFAVCLDMAFCRVPNWFVGISFLASQSLLVIQEGYIEGIRSLGLVTLIIVALFPLFVIGAIGAGDIKLLMILPSVFNLSQCFRGILLSFVLAAIMGFIKLLYNKDLRTRINNFLNYLFCLSKGGQVQIYDHHHSQNNLASNQIHFTLPILISVILLLGGL